MAADHQRALNAPAAHQRGKPRCRSHSNPSRRATAVSYTHLDVYKRQLHLSSRPDAWRQWYGANNYLYGPQAAGGPRYELFTMVMAAVQAGLGLSLIHI